MEFEGKVVFITGGIGGLGKAFCKAFLERGSKVCLGDVVVAKGDDVIKDFMNDFGRENVIYVNCDVTKQEDYEAAFQMCKAKLGEIDIMVNNAGIFNDKNPLKTIDVNLSGVLRGCELVIRRMGKQNGGRGGHIVNVASILGISPCALSPFYAATKAGVLNFSRSLGDDFHYAYSGVKVQALCPSFVETPLIEQINQGLYNDRCDAVLNDVLKSLVFLRPEKVADALMMLLSHGKNGAAMVVEHNKEPFYVEPSLDVIKI